MLGFSIENEQGESYIQYIEKQASIVSCLYFLGTTFLNFIVCAASPLYERIWSTPPTSQPLHVFQCAVIGSTVWIQAIIGFLCIGHCHKVHERHLQRISLSSMQDTRLTRVHDHFKFLLLLTLFGQFIQFVVYIYQVFDNDIGLVIYYLLIPVTVLYFVVPCLFVCRNPYLRNID
ncbi:MAG: hypothetical protein Sylvanvirus6_2 [Sylvanvirus sp.]|uniref:Uncharacterized protein n=1 Tax=Sylvanvirus sp. TaxID=2487774 RepID=A0A3G5AJK8_9VIRU|nr:MAG: hypothetical protein Sylvanvirus6_2 [Sylvanvirus sp.]